MIQQEIDAGYGAMIAPAWDESLRMTTLPEPQPSALATLPHGRITLYAIALDLNIAALEQHYSAIAPHNAYTEIRTILTEEGFSCTHGRMYFGDPARVNGVTCVLAARRLAVEIPWFARCVRDMRMLRIEENNDLMPAVNSAEPLDSGNIADVGR